MNDLILKTAKEMLQRAIDINGSEAKNMEEANWNLGFAHASIVNALDLLDILEQDNV